jgi:hypothetical protein
VIRKAVDIAAPQFFPGGENFFPGGGTFFPGGETFFPRGETFFPGEESGAVSGQPACGLNRTAIEVA